MSAENSKGTVRSRGVVEERRAQIYELHLRGLTEAEIAQTLGVNQSNVSRALSVMRQRNAKWFDRNKDPSNLFRSFFAEQRDRAMDLVREGWNLYHSIPEQNTAKRIQALNHIRGTLIYLGQITGLTIRNLEKLGHRREPGATNKRSEVEGNLVSPPRTQGNDDTTMAVCLSANRG